MGRKDKHLLQQTQGASYKAESICPQLGKAGLETCSSPVYSEIRDYISGRKGGGDDSAVVMPMIVWAYHSSVGKLILSASPRTEGRGAEAAVFLRPSKLVQDCCAVILSLLWFYKTAAE